MHFTDIFIRRPVLATVVSLLILLLGVRSLQLMTVRQYPESESAVVTVSTVYVGASADLVKGFVTTPLEKEIASADGIDYLESASLQGLSIITAQLELNYDPNKALTEISSKVDRVRNDLPVGSEVPTIDVAVGETTASMYLSFYSNRLASNQITDYLLRVVQPQLEAVGGVQRAEILGARTFAMRVWLKPKRMASLGIAPDEVRQALAANSFLAAVGRTKGQMISITLDADTNLHTAEEYQRLVIKEQDGTIVRLRDVAEVDLGAESYDNSVVFNGENATFIGVTVVPTANPLTVIREIRDLFPTIQQQFPPGLEGRIAYDATEYINDSIREVIRTLLEALVIVMAVIFLFLGSFRSVVIPAVAIPLSLVGAGFLMLLLGYSINLLTLLAMVLAIGLVVDDAIIVVENIHRHIEEGILPMQAALRGARELATPVIAMTITLVAVYTPIGFTGGLTGNLFTEFAFTLAGAVLISGVVALTLSPMMCSRLLTPEEGKEGFVHFLDVTFERLRRTYQRWLHGSLDYLPVTLVFGAGVLVSCYFLYGSVNRELAPTEDQGIVIVSSTGAPQSSIDQTEMWTRELDGIYRSFPEMEHYFLFNGVGASFTASQSGAISGLVMVPWSRRERSVLELQPLLQQKVSGIAGMQSVVFTPPPLPGSGRGLPVQFVVGSIDPPLVIYRASQNLVQRAWQSGLFAYVDSDLKYDRPQTVIDIDRDRAADLGLDMREVGGNLATMLGGNFVNRFSIQGRSYKVIPQVRRIDRLNPAQLQDYYFRSADGHVVPVSAFTSLHTTVEPRELKRFQQLNAATVSAVPAPGVSLGEALGFLRTAAAQVLPPGYKVDYAGQSRQYVEEGSSLLVTFFFAILIIYLVLAAQFESFRDPLIMLVSVPMSISGALIFLSLGFATLNIYTEVGLVTLIGLISKHGILIVQFANQLQAEGRTMRQAVEEAAGIRLRPILMTTAAMTLGVIPLLLASGAGARSRFDIGLVIFTGMLIGTAFTLFVVPAMYLALGAEVKTRSGPAVPGEAPSRDPEPEPDSEGDPEREPREEDEAEEETDEAPE